MLEILTVFQPTKVAEKMFGAAHGLLQMLAHGEFAKEADAFEKARRLEVISNFDPAATAKRVEAEQAFIKVVEKSDARRGAVLKAKLSEVTKIVETSGDAAKYGHDPKKWVHAEPCIRAIVSACANSAVATNELQKLGVDTLLRVFAITGTSLSQHADLGLHCASAMESIARHAKRLEKLMPELLKLDVDHPRYEQIMSALPKVGGTRWSIRGILLEMYISRWVRWQQHMEGQMLHAEAVAAKLGPPWRAVERYGEMWIGGKPTWDSAILIINEETKVAMVHTTGQFKAEGKLTAFDQVVKDFLREREPDALLTIKIKGQETGFRMEKLPDNIETERYVVFAGGGKIPPSAEEMLERLGLRTINLEADIHLKELDAATFVAMSAVGKLYETLKAAGAL